jgi:hypothetical protein
MKYFFIIIIVFILLFLVYSYNTEEFSTESINNISSIYGKDIKKFVANNVDATNANINTINVNDSINFPKNNFTYKLNHDVSGLTISLYNNSTQEKLNTYLTLDYSGNAIFNNNLNINSNLIANNLNVNNLNVNNTLTTNNDFIINGKIKSNITGTGWIIWKQSVGGECLLKDPVTGWSFEKSKWVVICGGNQFTQFDGTGVYTLIKNNYWYGSAGYGCCENTGVYMGTFIAIPNSFFDSNLITI